MGVIRVFLSKTKIFSSGCYNINENELSSYVCNITYVTASFTFSVKRGSLNYLIFVADRTQNKYSKIITRSKPVNSLYLRNRLLHLIRNDGSYGNIDSSLQERLQG